MNLFALRHRTVARIPIFLTEAGMNVVVPHGTKFLSAGFDNEEICVFAEVDPNPRRQPDERLDILRPMGKTAKVWMTETGGLLDYIPPPPYARFLGSVSDPRENIVWHVYVQD